MHRTRIALFTFGLVATSVQSTRADDHYVVVDDDHARLCAKEGGVVGRRPCPAYGEWGAALEAPYVFVGLGFNVRHLPRKVDSGSSRATARSVAQPTPSPGDAEGADSSITYAQRFGVSTSRASYAGIEAEIGATTADADAAATRTFGAAAHLFLGVHGGTRLLKLGVELAGGGRLIDTKLAGPTEELVLETRARGDLWLTPWVTLGAAIGMSLIDRGDWVAGLHIGVHSYSFAGWY